MEESPESKVSEYLEYFASICIVLSDDIKKHKVEDFNLIKQNLDEMSNSLQNVINIVDKDEKLFSGVGGIKETIRDFKINKIIDQKNI